ncbi:MAG: hypothetical protein GF311_01320 [Candidatus Lokiarchaeota archaeon]|nr:hypothetical protein [Candidatus Lokiarchaeota archaeon]
MRKESKYKILLILPFLIGFVIISSLYYYYLEEILITFSVLTIEAVILAIITSIRIIIVIFCGSFLLKQWFNQDEFYLSDLPFLTGLFFLILIPAKFLDLLSAYIGNIVSPESLLFLLKIRFILAIINLMPMIYLSIGIVLFYFSLNEKYSSLMDKKKREKLQKYLIILISGVELIMIIILPTYSAIFNIVPFFVIPSLIVILWVFIFAYRNKKLTSINSFIVSIGFGLYLLTTIFRSLGQYVFDDAIHLILSEMFELITNIIIFIGLVNKPKIKSD